jgi:hypothetical protein
LEIVQILTLRYHPHGTFKHFGRDNILQAPSGQHAKIGQLALENDFLDSALTEGGLLSAKP